MHIMKKSTSYTLIQLEPRALFAADISVLDYHQEPEAGSTLEGPVAPQSQEATGVRQFISGVAQVLVKAITTLIAVEVGYKGHFEFSIEESPLPTRDIDGFIQSIANEWLDSNK